MKEVKDEEEEVDEEPDVINASVAEAEDDEEEEEGGSAEDDEEDDDAEEEEEEEPDGGSDEEETIKNPKRKRVKRVKRIKGASFFANTYLNKEIQKFQRDKWMFRASFIVRLCVKEKKNKTPYFEWISKMAPYLSDFIKLDLFLVALNAGNTILATNIYLALNCPTHLFRRDLLSVVEPQCTVTNAVMNMIQSISDSPEAALIHGKRHVLFKLRTITEPISQLVINQSLLRKRIPFEILHLLGAQELWYLKEQKFRITVPELVDYAFKFDVSKVIEPYAKSAWVDVIKTFPFLEDTPYSSQPLVLPHHTPNTHRDFLSNHVSEFALTAYTSLLEECQTLDHKPNSDVFQEIEPGKLQLLLSLLHKSPALLKSALARRTLDGLRFICLFRKKYWHVMVQLLMQPETNVNCWCINEKLIDIRKQRSHRYYRPESSDVGRSFHTCPGIPRLITPTISPACNPWYKPDCNGNGSFGSGEWCKLVLKSRLTHPYSLTNKGRVIVISHFLALLYWNQVAATTCMVVAEVVLSLNKQCSEKTFREAFTIISSIPIPEVSSKEKVEFFLETKSSPETDYLHSVHEMVLHNKQTPATTVLLQLYAFVEKNFF